MLKIIFMGTPEFAVPIFNSLLDAGHNVCAAVTQPDRPKGRGHSVSFSPVKAAAIAAGVPVIQPQALRGNRDARVLLKSYDADVFVVAAYGLILPQKILDMPRLGCVNVHASLLPRYRGASPIHYAILNGDAATGITVMYMARGIDTGDIILQKKLPINAGERFPSLHDRMAALGGECIAEALDGIENGTSSRVPQDCAWSSYAPMINKEDGLIDWSVPAGRIINLTRALDPWPGSYTVLNGINLKIWECEKIDITDGQADARPGDILSADAASGLIIRAGDGALLVTELQAVGGKRMKAVDYLRGHKI